MRIWKLPVRLAAVLAIAMISGAAIAQGDPVATVNGEAIGFAEFYERLQRVNVRDFVISLNPLSLRTQTAGQVLLDQMINERLTIQWATKTNLMPTEADVEAEFVKVKAQPQLQQMLASHLISEQFLKFSIRYQKARFNMATIAASVSPQDVEKYYKDHIGNYTVPERYTLEGLRTGKQPDVAKIQADLKAGKSFAEVVKAYCEDASLKERNGAMGTLSAMDPQIPAPIREAAAALKDGQISPPVKVEVDPGGGKPKVPIWWFLRMAHREPSTTQPFAAVKSQVEQAALLEKAGGIQVADKKISDFRQLSDIKIKLAGYEALLPKAKQS
jgi:parvulin-like peptidyl-prolyl isomerase